MDIKLNAPAKKIVKIEVLHLDEIGYGPAGAYKRSEWRTACLNHLLAGKDIFKTWQESWQKQIEYDLTKSSFGCEIIFDDGSTEYSLDDFEHSAYSIDFVGHIFEQSLDASGFEFLKPTLFKNASFNGYVSFGDTIFNGYVDFFKTKFIGYANFSNVIFSGSSDFNTALFNAIADFRNAAFNGRSYFTDTVFNMSTDFCSAAFSMSADFRNAEFNGEVDFVNSTFSRTVDFSNAVFGGDALISSATFSGNAKFQQVTFQKQCRFDSVFNQKLKAWGKETSFSSIGDFENAVFGNVGHFERVQFLGQMPSFLGVANATTRLEFSGDEYFTKTDVSENAVKRLGLLKRLADEHGQTDQALMFNALELRAKAKQPNAGWSLKLVTGLYEYVSNFGRSFLRPLAIYASILLLTFLVALEHSAYNAPRNYTKQGCDKYIWWIERVSWIEDANCLPKSNVLQLTGIRAAGEYTLYRAAGVLDFSDNGKATDAVANRLFGQSIEPWWMRVWGVFKAIASTALLFLAALGLRNKYRIK